MCSWPSTVGWEFLILTFSAPAVGCCLTHTHTHTHTHILQQTTSFSGLSLMCFCQGGRFLWMVFNNHGNKWLLAYCFLALLRCTRGSRSRAVRNTTGIRCESWGATPVPISAENAAGPCLSKHTIHKTQSSNLHSQWERLNQSIQHLPYKHLHSILSSLTLLLADGSPW